MVRHAVADRCVWDLADEPTDRIVCPPRAPMVGGEHTEVRFDGVPLVRPWFAEEASGEHPRTRREWLPSRLPLPDPPEQFREDVERTSLDGDRMSAGTAARGH